MIEGVPPRDARKELVFASVFKRCDVSVFQVVPFSDDDDWGNTFDDLAEVSGYPTKTFSSTVVSCRDAHALRTAYAFS